MGYGELAIAGERPGERTGKGERQRQREREPRPLPPPTETTFPRSFCSVQCSLASIPGLGFDRSPAPEHHWRLSVKLNLELMSVSSFHGGDKTDKHENQISRVSRPAFNSTKDNVRLVGGLRRGRGRCMPSARCFSIFLDQPNSRPGPRVTARADGDGNREPKRRQFLIPFILSAIPSLPFLALPFLPPVPRPRPSPRRRESHA